MRELQALVGVVMASVGVGFYDWRAGLITAGAALLLDYLTESRRAEQ